MRSSHEDERDDLQDPISAFLSRVFGSPLFVYVCLVGFFLWVGGNIVANKMGYNPIDSPDTFFNLIMVMGFYQVFVPSFLLIADNARERRGRRWERKAYSLIEKMDRLLETHTEILERGTAEREANVTVLRLNQLRVMAAQDRLKKVGDANLCLLMELAEGMDALKQELIEGDQNESTGDAAGRRYAERLAGMDEDGRAGAVGAGGSVAVDGGFDPAH